MTEKMRVRHSSVISSVVDTSATPQSWARVGGASGTMGRECTIRP
jgi:hypothetical protein